MAVDIDKLINDCLLDLHDTLSLSDLNNGFGEQMNQIMDALKISVKQKLTKHYHDNLLYHIKVKEQIHKEKISTEHKNGFDALSMFIDLNKYCADRTLIKLKEDKTKHISIKESILFRIHVRACETASEIQILLKHGYSDGAHARWRTIHELAVIFLILFDNPERVSQMYFDYYVIENEKRARKFERYHKRMNWPALAKDEINMLYNRRKKLIKKYGDEFGGDYGWAMDILPKDKRSFANLEKLVDMDYMRPIFAWSSNIIHSNIGGLTAHVNNMNAKVNPFLKFVTPTHYMLGDPAQFTTSSLFTITSKLLTYYNDLESHVMHFILQELESKTRSDFIGNTQ